MSSGREEEPSDIRMQCKELSLGCDDNGEGPGLIDLLDDV